MNHTQSGVKGSTQIDTQIIRTYGSSSSASSSSSSSDETSQSTNSSSESQTSASSASSTSNESIASGKSYLLRGPRVKLYRQGEMNKGMSNGSDTSSSSSSSSGSGSNSSLNEATITSSAIRRYKSSPFGLTNHYLAMPEVSKKQDGKQRHLSTSKERGTGDKKTKSDVARGKRRVIDSDTSEQQVTNNSTAEKVLSWNKNNRSKAGKDSSSDQDLTQLSNRANSCDLSVLAPSSAASLGGDANWDDGYARHHNQTLKNQPRQLDPIGLVAISPTPYGSEAAGDAGLDARKCNAKDTLNRGADCYYYQDHGPAHKLNPVDLPIQRPNMLIGAAPNAKHKVVSSSSSSGLLVRFSSIMYATFLVILGCILHISELRQKSMNSSDHIYTIVVAMIGIIWLVFLQLDLHRYKRYASKYILIETIFNDHRQRNLEAQRHGELVVDPSARSTTSSSASLVNDRMSMNTEVIFKKTAYKMYQQRAALSNRQNGYLRNHHQRYSHHRDPADCKLSSSSGSDPACDVGYKLGGSGAMSVKGSALSVNGDNESHQKDLTPAYKFRHGKMGANFYLKCGMAAFCFGHVIHEGLRFGQQLYFFGTGNVQCRDSAALVAHLITPLYSFYQLFMMFKYSNLVINRHKVLARFGLMHIIGTSVTFWFRTIIEEAFEDFVHKMDYFRTNKPQLGLGFLGQHQPTISSESQVADLSSLLATISQTLKAEASDRIDSANVSQWLSQRNITMAKSLFALMSSPMSATITPQIARHLPESYACAQNTLLTTKSMNALPYLYPFTIEYNLLLAATFLSLYFNIGKVGISDSTCDPIVARASSQYYRGKPKMPMSSSGSSRMSHMEFSENSSSAIRMGGGGGDSGGHSLGEYKSNFVVNADCHAANKGLFCGFFVLLVTLVTIVIFFVTINKPTHVQLGIKINLIQEATLTSLIVIVTLAAFKQVVKLNRNPFLKDKVTTDDVLMLIPLPFFFIHSLLSFRAETASMYSGSSLPAWSSGWTQNNHQGLPTAASSSNTLQSILISGGNNNTQIADATRHRLNSLLAGLTNSSSNNGTIGGRRNSTGSGNGSNINPPKVDHFKLLTLALNLIVMIEVLVQTNFIIDGMRRCSESRYLRFKKPGRELITFAIILNITYWIVATFETKSVEQYKTEIEYYGPLPYMFISHTTLPVMLFYRYHSSVCLAEIWNRAYKPPKKR